MSCLRALDEGLPKSLYDQFLSSLWGHENPSMKDPPELKHSVYANPDSEWDSFTDMLMLWCGKSRAAEPVKTAASYPAWDYLLQSVMHRKNKNMFPGLSLPSSPKNSDSHCRGHRVGSAKECIEYASVLGEVLLLLHIVYEDHKLDCLHWR